MLLVNVVNLLYDVADEYYPNLMLEEATNAFIE